jgi:hypothetical protein
MSKEEKQAERFHDAPDLNVEFFKKLEEGRVLSLMSGSYIYPEEDIFIDVFEYKHNCVDQIGYKYEVIGFSRHGPFEEWTPIKFDADEKECRTFTNEGTIKLKVPGIG